MDLEPGRNRAPSQDLFVSYHANDDLQVTYAGAAFHTIRNYYISPVKHDVSTQNFLFDLMSTVILVIFYVTDLQSNSWKQEQLRGRRTH